MKHRDKHKGVFVHLLQLERIRANRAYMCKSWYAKPGSGQTQHIINDRGMTKTIQLKNININKSHNKHCILLLITQPARAYSMSAKK